MVSVLLGLLFNMQVKLGVTRDPSRLFKLTAGWEERRKADTEDQKIGVGWRALPRRAVPAWRQGL